MCASGRLGNRQRGPAARHKLSRPDSAKARVIPVHKKRMAVAGAIGLVAYVAAAVAASVAEPREPGLWMKLAPWLAAAGAVAFLFALWSLVKAKGRSGWWMLTLLLSVVGLGVLAFLTDRGSAGEVAQEEKHPLRRFLSYIVVSSGQLVVALVAFLSVYSGWIWWEGRQLHALCAEANEGIAVSALPALADKYGFARRWVTHGIRDRSGAGWVVYVPSSSTIGEFRCAIHYNDTRVLWARVK